MNKKLSYGSDLYELAYCFSVAWMQFHFNISMDQSEEILLSGDSQQNNSLRKTLFNKKKQQQLYMEEAEKIHRLLINISQGKDISKIIIDLGEVAKKSSNLSGLFEDAEYFYHKKHQNDKTRTRGGLTSGIDTALTINDLNNLLEKPFSMIETLNEKFYGDIKEESSLDVSKSYERLEFDIKSQNEESHKIKSDTQKSINELRKLSGLSWEKIANLFDVSLKNTYFWASGREIDNQRDVEKLYQLLDSIKYIDRGSASLNRNILLKTLSDGILPLDLLLAGKYQEFKSILGSGTPLERPKANPLSEESLKLRKPISLENIVDARQETIHKSV